MKKINLPVLVSLVVLLAGCDIQQPTLRLEALTNDLRVVNFVSTNKVFVQTLEGARLRVTAESEVTLTNGQLVSAEAMIYGYAPGGRIDRIIVYPKQ